MSAPVKAKAKKAKKKRAPRKARSRGLQGSDEAKRLASLILEVLGGLRTVTEACEEVGMTLQRYYRLETGAIQAVVNSLEPKPRGKQPKPENVIAKLTKERDRLERELRRAQSLVRVAQRTVGLSASPSQGGRGRKGKAKGKKRKKRPRVRVRAVIDELIASPPDQALAPSEAQPSQGA